MMNVKTRMTMMMLLILMVGWGWDPVWSGCASVPVDQFSLSPPRQQAFVKTTVRCRIPLDIITSHTCYCLLMYEYDLEARRSWSGVKMGALTRG